MRRTAKWNAFYNTSTEASYQFDLQLVVLDSVDSSILTALDNDAPAARYKVLRLAAHEYTHWRDQVATLWGRRLLNRFYDGVAAWVSQDVYRFRSILEAQRAIARCSTKRYYRVEGPKTGSSPPWRASLSIGLAFDADGVPNTADPIPFVRFSVPSYTSENGLIVRMPISAASLAEVRAMYAEYCWIQSEERRYPNGATPADSVRWMMEYQTYAYDQEFLDYTTALHLLSNQTGAQLVSEILPHASALAGVALNLPESLISSLRVPKLWEEAWGAHGRIQPLLDNRDPGFLFSLLCTHAEAPTAGSVDQWLESVLQAAGGFGLAQLRTEWENELRATTARAGSRERSDHTREMWLRAGLDWALVSDPTAPPDALIRTLNAEETLALPGALTADWKIWLPRTSKGYENQSEIQARIQALELVVSKMDEFCDVCGR